MGLVFLALDVLFSVILLYVVNLFLPCVDLPRQQWSLLNRFRTEQGHCGACRRKWRLTDTDLCFCGETQTMSHIVESCPLTKLNGGLSRLHSADEDAVSWLTNYGSWNAYEKKKRALDSTLHYWGRLSVRLSVRNARELWGKHRTFLQNLATW